MLFYNPLLNPDDIFIESFNDDLDGASFDAPEPAELVTGLLGQASNPESPAGQII